MTGRRARGCILALALFGAACSHPDAAPPAPAEEHAPIGGDVVARVGDDSIPASLVAGVARAKHEDPRQALTDLVEDSLFAQGARARGLDRRTDVARDLEASDARLVMLRAREQAAAQGPPTDTEVEELSRLHWREVDAPELVEVVHAVALRPKKKAADPAAARATAEAIEAAVKGASSPEDFEARAKAVPKPDGVDVRVEELPPFAQDGRIAVGGDGSMDTTFAAAAFALAPGATSGVVETQFGWHVIRLVRRVPPNRLAFETRRQSFVEETNARRARRAYDAVLAARRASTPIEVAQDAEELMAQVSYGSPPSPTSRASTP